ncbi:MAG: histidine kinase [Bacteroidales bacterium]|nr:histidine kinase [Bacteroidales bacterium]
MNQLSGLLPLPFLVLGGLLALFLLVVALVNLWVKYRTWKDDDWLVQQIYTRRRMLALYLKCWLVIMAGVLLLLFSDMILPLQVICVALTIGALTSIVASESLEEVRLRRSQMENQILRSQLNPHFLYNTLNNIDALIWLDPQKASDAVTNLSELMRYFTYSARQEHVEVGEEVKHLQELAALQRLRMQHEDALRFNTHIDNPKQPVAPLLLLPLMENCFKHCGSLNEPGAICLDLEIREGRLVYQSSNNLPAEPKNGNLHVHGVGMKVLRRRLKLLYPDRFELTANLEGGRFVTKLEVRLNG